MPNNSNHVLIAGPAGSGKTTLAEYFKSHGKNAVDADIAGIGVWADKEGKRFNPPPHIGKGINQWAFERELFWSWDVDKVKALLNNNNEIYLFGGAYNMHDLAKLFDKKYYLHADPDLVLERLDRRTKEGKSYHAWGETEEQRLHIIGRLESGNEWARRLGFVFLDASLPPEKIFEAICGRSTRRSAMRH